MDQNLNTDVVETDVVETKEPKKPRKANRMTEETLAELYPHVVPGTLHFLDGEDKQAVQIECAFTPGSSWDVEAEAFVAPADAEPCSRRRTVRTSDLFQVDKCEVCTLKARRAKAKARRAAKKAAKPVKVEDAEIEIPEDEDITAFIDEG